MKEGIEAFLKITEENVKKLDLVTAKDLLSIYTDIKNAADKLWELFQAFDTDKSEARTLTIIKNHASGLVIGETQKLRDLTRSLRFYQEPKPEIISEQKETFEKIKASALNYLEYYNHKAVLEYTETVLQNRLSELTSGENRSNFTMGI